jgi:bifunctional non-homologous end joining protein LigD
MQAGSAEAPFSSPDYLFEVKWDGVRAVLFRDPDGTVRAHDRALADLTPLLPELVEAEKALPPGTVLDGELVATDEEGRPDYHRLRQRLEAGAATARDSPVSYVAFDLLYLRGKSLLRQPLDKRRARLRREFPAEGAILVPDHIAENGVDLYEACLERGLEGVMAKHKNSTYVPGQRSPFWLKVKAVQSDDFVVVGWLPKGAYGALLVAYHERGQLLPAGTVTGGFDPAVWAALEPQLEALSREESPLEPPPIITGQVRWVEPSIVISVRYSEWSADGTLRFPIFNDLRPEVHPAECVRHRPRVVLENRIPPENPAYWLSRFPFDSDGD